MKKDISFPWGGDNMYFQIGNRNVKTGNTTTVTVSLKKVCKANIGDTLLIERYKFKVLEILEQRNPKGKPMPGHIFQKLKVEYIPDL